MSRTETITTELQTIVAKWRKTHLGKMYNGVSLQAFNVPLMGKQIWQAIRNNLLGVVKFIGLEQPLAQI